MKIKKRMCEGCYAESVPAKLTNVPYDKLWLCEKCRAKGSMSGKWKGGE